MVVLLGGVIDDFITPYCPEKLFLLSFLLSAGAEYADIGGFLLDSFLEWGIKWMMLVLCNILFSTPCAKRLVLLVCAVFHYSPSLHLRSAGSLSILPVAGSTVAPVNIASSTGVVM